MSDLDEFDPISLFPEYVAECDEHLTAAGQLLLDLEASAGQLDRPQLDSLFRNFHTVKGLSAMVGLHEAERLAHHLESYLGAIRRGRAALSPEGAAVLDQAVEAARPLIDARRHHLSVTPPGEAIHLDADPARLAQVVGNLLNNAGKYMDEGGRIWLDARRDGDEAVISVRDAGVGITPEMLPKVFDLFTQIDRTLDRSQGGLGVGLTLVRSLVELHGGTVRASSPGPGRGSEFVVRLPALRTAAGPPGDRPDGPAPAPPPSQPCRILVVDDNVDAADSLAALLELSGHVVWTAYGGAAALEVAEAHRPQMVLLDIGLPGMDGHEVARRLRRHPALSDVMLVALTGYGQDEDRRRTHEAGFDHHLVKPLDPDDLARLMMRVKA